MTDVIDAMEKGRLTTPVADNMTREVRTVSKDASLTEALNNLGREGVARLPVVDGDGNGRNCNDRHGSSGASA